MQYTQLLNRRILALVGSVIILFLVIGLLKAMIASRPLPEANGTGTGYIPTVQTITVKPGRPKISVTATGTVQAEKNFTLNAPYAGRVHAKKNIVPGISVAANQVLFAMETTKLDLAIERLEVQKENLTLERQRLEIDAKQLENRLQSAKASIAATAQQLEASQRSFEAQRQLFDKRRILHGQSAISDAEFLRAEATYNQALEARLQAENNLELAKERDYNLRQLVAQNAFQYKSLKQRERELELQTAELQEDRNKALIALEYPTRVLDVFVDQEQEVTPGTPLASVRSVDAVELTVQIPDSYFKWLYAGRLLEKSSEPTELDITLVNRDFRKVFGGGYLKATGGQLNVPTRSLPLVIGRQNPLDAEGNPIESEELKPGMYCEVEIPLAEIENGYSVPLDAMQRENRLYQVLIDEEGVPRLHILTDAKVLHETHEKIIFRLPDSSVEELMLISHPVRQAEEGMQVTLQSEAGA